MAGRAVMDPWYRRLPRYLYFEEQLRGRKVVEIGCGLGGGCHFLRDKGVGQVWGVDADEAMLEQARRQHDEPGIEFLAWKEALPLRDGCADLVAVPDALEWLARPDFLVEVRRVLAPSGRLLLCVPSADRAGGEAGLSYYDLFEQLTPHFERVRMVGQSPFLGYALLEYAEAEGEPDLVLDTSLVETPEEVTHYIALAGPDDAVEAGGLLITQIPGSAFSERRLVEAEPAEAPRPEPPDAGRVAALERALEEADKRARATEARLREEIDRLHAGRPPEPSPLLSDRLALVQGEREGLAWRVRELEGQLASSAERFRDLLAEVEERLADRERALDEAAEAADLHRVELEEREAALEEQTTYLVELEQELERVEQALEQTRREASEANLRAEAAAAETSGARKRVAELEGQLLRAPAAPPKDAELERVKERLSLAESQTALWMSKFQESERKAEEARTAATRKLLDAKSVAASQLQRSLEESTRKMTSAAEEALRAERERKQAVAKLAEVERELERVKTEAEARRAAMESERVAAQAALAKVESERVAAQAARAKAEAGRSELERALEAARQEVAQREEQLQRMAGAAVRERRSAEGAAEKGKRAEQQARLLADAQATVGRLKSELVTAKRELRTTTRRRDLLERALEKASGEARERKKVAQDLRRELKERERRVGEEGARRPTREPRTKTKDEKREGELAK